MAKNRADIWIAPENLNWAIKKAGEMKYKNLSEYLDNLIKFMREFEEKTGEEASPEKIMPKPKTIDEIYKETLAKRGIKK